MAGRFSLLGKQLLQVKNQLRTKLDREPSIEEWASSCRVSESDLLQYLDLSDKAKDRLVQHNLRIVDYWARRLLEHTKAAKEVSYYELVTEGVIGLRKAVDRYDGRIPFGKFAQPFVRGELYKGLTALRPGSFLSHQAVMIAFRVHRMRQRLAVKLQRDPTDEETAAAMHTNVSSLRRAVRDSQLKRTVISGDSIPPTPDGTQTHGYFDLFLRADQSNGNREELLQWKMNFLQALDCLTPLERRTLTIRYGLEDGVSRSVEHTAELMCLSSEGIRLVVSRAIEKLRQLPKELELELGPPKPLMETSSGRIGLTSTF